MRVKRENLLICTKDYGGHPSGYCAICEMRGWLDKKGLSKLKHKEGCPVAENVEFVEVHARIPRDRIAEKNEGVRATTGPQFMANLIMKLLVKAGFTDMRDTDDAGVITFLKDVNPDYFEISVVVKKDKKNKEKKKDGKQKRTSKAKAERSKEGFSDEERRGEASL